MRVLCYSTHKFDQPYLEKAFASSCIELDFEERLLSLNTVHLSKSYDGIMVFSSDDCSQSILRILATNGVQYLATRSTGYDHIDLQTAKNLNIKVANVPSYSPQSIAEHVVAMLLQLSRKLNKARSLIEMQDFRLDQLIGFNLHKTTVGIIGMGMIGKSLTNILNGFGCKVIAFDPVEDVFLEKTGLCEFMSLDKVFALSVN